MALKVKGSRSHLIWAIVELFKNACEIFKEWCAIIIDANIIINLLIIFVKIHVTFFIRHGNSRTSPAVAAHLGTLIGNSKTFYCA